MDAVDWLKAQWHGSDGERPAESRRLAVDLGQMGQRRPQRGGWIESTIKDSREMLRFYGVKHQAVAHGLLPVRLQSFQRRMAELLNLFIAARLNGSAPLGLADNPASDGCHLP